MAVIVAALVVMGLLLGSFVNAMVWRIHERHTVGPGLWRAMNGRSMCPRCRHPLAARDLVPVLSWLAVRGRCRYCRAPIEDSVLVEATLPALFVLSYLLWPLPAAGFGLAGLIGWLLLCSTATGLVAYRVRWMRGSD